MALQQIITVLSGKGVSSAFAVAADRPFAIFVPSHAPKGWAVAFATSSDGTTFHVAHRPETGLITVCSGGGTPQAGFVQYPLSPWARLEVRGAAFAIDSTTIPVSATIVGLNRA